MLLRKCVSTYEYMDEWENFNKSNLNMKDTTDADFIHVKRVFKDFEIKIYVNIMIYILKVIHYFWLIFLET